MKYLFAVVLGGVVLLGGLYVFQEPSTDDIVSPIPAEEVVANTQPAANEPVTPIVDEVSSSAGEYTLADVALHGDQTSCWSAIRGVVYDLTTWIDKHPGGAQRILSICGKDGSAAFTQQHEGAEKPEAMLASFKVGVLK